ncbi:MAG: tRNA (adenosine(37)-N6)-dimethylallyltransferase MiaA [Polynucleobacter sp.]|nr:tRNA (adenosine(37)-N6)-dimethylallyltransferase MiaA [Polynucleobacter sp.]
MPTESHQQPLLSIAGPTGSGKTHFAMLLAEAAQARSITVELISMDSALVYRGMDIGSAKPTLAERAAVKHHLIDILDPIEAYSAARFASDTTQLVNEIRQRGNMPVIVGGTMLYWRAFAYGLSSLPPADPVIRARLDAQGKALGWPAMHAELMAVDPITAARLEPNDSQRIQRALEVVQSTGKPMSAWLAESPSEDGRAGSLIPSWLRLVSLEPSERAQLHRNLESRFDGMLQAGLIEEVRLLRAHPGIHADLPAMRAVGYRQVWEFLEGQINAEQMRYKALAATRQLGKRQLTWLRAIEGRTVFNPFDVSGLPAALQYCLDQISTIK